MKELYYLKKYFFKYRYRFFMGTFFVVISNIFALFPAQYVRKAFDTVKYSIENNQNENLYFEKNIFYFSALIIVFALLKGLFMFFMRQTIIVMSRMIEYDIKNEIYNHYQKLDLQFYKKNNTGDLMSRISEDVSRVRMFLGPATMYPINMISLFSLIVYTMININLKLTLFVLLPLPIMSISIFYISKIINLKSEKVQRQLAKISTFSQETFSGIRVVKSFINEKLNNSRFEDEASTYLNKNISLAKTNAMFFPFMLLLIGLSTLLTIYIGGQEAIKGNITTGNIAEFIIYVNMLTWPMASIGWVTSIIQRAEASQKRINEFLKTKPKITNLNFKNKIKSGEIIFKNVSFTYPVTNITALKNISFKIDKGSSLAIIGKTGSGKSTIANLICRFYDIKNGEIKIDMKPIKNLNLSFLRNDIGYVTQEALLFSDTIYNNISFGTKTKNSLNKIKKYARIAGIDNEIEKFPNSYNTIIGERGITLSGGQKQRISISRALIKKPKILIFDDCLSALDTKTEDLILKNLKTKFKNTTKVIISHRISSIKHVDQIIVLENGEIIERGKHEELLKSKNLYFEMYNQQLNKNNVHD